jgi:two-component system, NarL family, nitrate/nitrite response regulator NarL
MGNLRDQIDRIRLLLVHDHVLFRTSLARLLSAEPGFEVVGESGAAGEALDVLRDSTVDVVLLDFNSTAERDGLIPAARSAGYAGQFLVITGPAEVGSYADALKVGASGIFLQSQPPDRLVQAIRVVASGAVWLDQTVARLFAEQVAARRAPRREPPAAWLEDREEVVLEGILAGLTNRRIGTSMGLSESSVKNILQGLFGKAGVRTRSQLVRLALEGSLGAMHSAGARQSGG